MGYPNLKAEMARSGIGNSDIAKKICKDKSTVSTLMNGGRSGFRVKDAIIIRDAFFPSMTLDYLFSETPKEPSNSN